MVGGRTSETLEHLFVSIQSLNSKDLCEITSEDYYDFIIVDEFHNAAAPSYKRLLSYYEPKVLLGLTTTPERNDYNYNRLNYIDKNVDLGFVCPLDINCNYSAAQILSALWYSNEYRKPNNQSGVLYIKDKKLDVFFVTLNKSEKEFSTSTLYEDYAINEVKFHWQSQSNT